MKKGGHDMTSKCAAIHAIAKKGSTTEYLALW